MDTKIIKTFNMQGTMPEIGQKLCQEKVAIVKDSFIIAELIRENEELRAKLIMREEQLKSFDKLSFLGKHCLEVVHNFKNPLTIITGLVEILKSKYPTDDKISSMEAATNRLTKLINQILQIGHEKNSNQSEPVMCDVNTIIKDELDFFRYSNFFKYKVVVSSSLNSTKKVKAESLHLSQIINNILKNSIDALYESKNTALEIKTFDENDCVKIIIKDSGIGIKSENLEKIFDPYFTTKPKTSDMLDAPTGTGLGLSSVQRILEKYSGKLKIESQEKLGTTVIISLPT